MMEVNVCFANSISNVVESQLHPKEERNRSWRYKASLRMQEGIKKETGKSKRKPREFQPLRRLLMPPFPDSVHERLREGGRKASLLEPVLDINLAETPSERIASHYSPVLKRMDRKKLSKFRQVLSDKTVRKQQLMTPSAQKRRKIQVDAGAPDSSQAMYQISTDAEKLYKTEFTDVEKMTLDLFDDGELETRLPHEWLEGPDVIDPETEEITPFVCHARSLWCESHEWQW